MHVPHATIFREKLKTWILIFLQKKLFRIKTAITFAYGLKKMCNIWKLSTQKVTFDFNGRRLFAQILASQNSKGKYESMKILDFAKK
jgi:hypothetical protein